MSKMQDWLDTFSQSAGAGAEAVEEVDSSAPLTETQIEDTLEVKEVEAPQQTSGDGISELQRNCKEAAKRGREEMALLSKEMDEAKQMKIRRTKGGTPLDVQDLEQDPPKEAPGQNPQPKGKATAKAKAKAAVEPKDAPPQEPEPKDKAKAKAKAKAAVEPPKDDPPQEPEPKRKARAKAKAKAAVEPPKEDPPQEPKPKEKAKAKAKAKAAVEPKDDPPQEPEPKGKAKAKAKAKAAVEPPKDDPPQEPEPKSKAKAKAKAKAAADPAKEDPPHTPPPQAEIQAALNRQDTQDQVAVAVEVSAAEKRRKYKARKERFYRSMKRGGLMSQNNRPRPRPQHAK